MAQPNAARFTSRRPFTILGILLALLVMGAFVLVAINASAGQITPTESVVIATQNLQPRVPINAASLEIKSIPIGGYPDAILFHKTSDVMGLVPLVTIEQGQAITSNLIAKPGTVLGGQGAFLTIDSGFVAYTLPTSEQQGVAGYIAPGDYIAIIATIGSGASIWSATIYHDIRVIVVGTPGSNSQQGGASIASSLTVEVTECQAEFLTWFLTSASLKYTLESYHDYKPGPATPDPNCASVTAAHGVGLADVKSAFPQLFKQA